MKKLKLLKRLLIIFLCMAVVGTASLFIINGCVKSVGKCKIVTVAQAAELEDVD